MIGVVLTSFLMLDLDEIFSRASLVYFEYPDTISTSIKNIPVIQDSRKRLGGNVESWQGFWCWILMKLPGKLPWNIFSTLTPSTAHSKTSLPCKTPGRDLKDSWILYKLPDVGSWWNCLWSFSGIFWVPWPYLYLHQEHPSPLWFQEETWRWVGPWQAFDVWLWLNFQ